MREAVRSGRRANFFITENSFIDHYARDVKPLGIAVYHVLERHANYDTRSTWISTKKMAELLGYSQRQIQRTLKTLQDFRLIRILETEDRITYVVDPVPPRGKRATTPLFDHIADPASSDDAQPTPMSLFATPASDAATDMSETTTSVSQYASAMSPASDIHGIAYKEEQNLLNKTQEQDLRGNKTLEQDAPKINKSAKRILEMLGLDDSHLATAAAALKTKVAQTGLSIEAAATEIATDANHARRKNVPHDKFLENAVAQVSAQAAIEHLSLTATSSLLSVVTAAIKAEAKYSDFSVEEAAASITRAAFEDRQRGIHIDKFYFEDAKWRNHGQTGKGQQQFERIKRARNEAHALIDAQMDR